MPAVSQLSARQDGIVKACLRVVADEPSLFPDWEFQTIFGVKRSEMTAVANAWPDVDREDSSVDAAIQNAMNNLLGYPHPWHKGWSDHFDFSPNELAETLAAWSGRKPNSYFDMML